MSSKDDLRTVLSKSFRAPHFFCFFIRRHILLKIEPITMKLVQVIGQKWILQTGSICIHLTTFVQIQKQIKRKLIRLLIFYLTLLLGGHSVPEMDKTFE